jgi:hypothetical protein
MTFKELLEFNTTYRAAAEFLELGTDDYVASRCCLLNGVFPGLRLGAEAVEKYLKAFVLYIDPARKLRKYDHGIKDVAAAASELRPNFDLKHFAHIIDRLETHYRHRYPDAPDFKHDARTDELPGIDELVLYIYGSLPIPEVPKLHTYGYYSFVCRASIRAMEPYKKWLERDNIALSRIHDSLLQRYQIAEEELRRFEI